MPFPHVFEPVALRHKTLVSRITFGAHTANMAEGGLPGERHIGYYRERALGGAGMIVVEPVPVHRTAVLTRGNFRHGDDTVVPHFRRLIDACREANPDIVMIQQLYHVGQHGDADNSFAPNWSPSGLPSYHDADGTKPLSRGFGSSKVLHLRLARYGDAVTTSEAPDHPTLRRGRAARQAERLARTMEHLPYLTRQLPPVEVVSAEGLEAIEHNADTLLQEVGIEVVNFPEAVEIFRSAGADVQGSRVRFERGMCRSLVQATAPRSFTQRARNPERSVVIGDPHMVLVPTYGSPFIHNLDDGRRYATIEDFRNFVKLAYTSTTLHHGGGTLCEPTDLPVNKRHFEMVYSHIRYTDKAFMGSVTHPSRAQDSVDMAKIAFGPETLETEHVIMGLANANSPMSWDFNMLGSAKVYAENNQIMLITPFILGGAMAPVTVAASATQTLAEALAGMAFCQIVRPGAPVIFGSFASSMSMQTGAPTFGTPEPQLVLFVLAALARRLGVPFRSGGNFTASKLPDYQAAYESAISFMATMQAGVNFNLHTAGWLEGGLAIGYEKFMLDEDQASMAGAYLAGVDLSENGLALQAMLDGGPGQHFLGSPHTLANFENAFWRSDLSDNNSFEQWELNGGHDAAQRANAAWKRRLAEYEEPRLDDAVHEELVAWMDQRKASFPDSDV